MAEIDALISIAVISSENKMTKPIFLDNSY